ncbi:MAG: sulfotransferase domain-containing protein [Gammaproteobacteria bacterium]|nr:sulfotransferase domain-containing protein [Gammaproteobacteria bacterium]
MIVWLASYPRSGNTFFRVILKSIFGLNTYSIYNDKGDIGADAKTSKIVGHEFLPKDFDMDLARVEDKLYVIKTHEQLDDRIFDDDKVIYLIRDGRDCALSFTKHQNIYSNKNKKNIDTIYGNTFIGSWAGHVTSWNPINRKNTLLVKFEELIKAPLSFVDVIAEYLDIEPLGSNVPTFDELKMINPKFFRTGQTNLWEEELSYDDHIAFWLESYSQMKEYGYDYKVPEVIEDCKELDLLRSVTSEISYFMRLFLHQDKIRFSLDEKNKELDDSRDLIRKKNKELEESVRQIEIMNREFKESNDESEIRLKLLEDAETSLRIMRMAIESIRNIKTIYHPFKKIKAYKNIINCYNEVVGKN